MRSRSPRARRGRSRSRSRSRSPRRHRDRSRRDEERRRRSPSRSKSRSRSRSRSGERDRQRRRARLPRAAERNEPPRTGEPANPAAFQWGKKDEESAEEEEAQPMEKPNFGLSGALAKDQATGNVQNGVVMKWSEPPEARVPTHRYRLYVFKNGEVTATLHVHRKSAFLIGRDKTVADILTEHESCSKQHAVLQYRLHQKPTEDGLGFEQLVLPYIMDLNSTNSTFLNGKKIESARYIQLKTKDVLKFGDSTREYVLMDAT